MPTSPSPRPLPARPPEALPLGVKLRGGSYSAGRVLGRGGFGITYTGSEPSLRRLVALKEFFPEGAERDGLNVRPGALEVGEFEDARAKFVEEARWLAQFRAPGIVGVHTYFEENNTAYMVMEYLEGRTLQRVVEDEGALDEARALEMMRSVGLSLEQVHEAGAVHRDIKPENIILCDDGRAVLIDFGLTRQLRSTTRYGTQQLSQTTALGTPGYAPPEQYGSHSAPSIAGDVYALGATLYFLLSGRTPLSALERMNTPLLAPHDLNPQSSRNSGEAVLRAMSLRADERPQSVGEWLVMLQPGAASASRVAFSPVASASTTPVTTTGTTVLNGTMPPASMPPVAGVPVVVKVSARVLLWPRLCSCCGASLPRLSKVATGTPQTHRPSGLACIKASIIDWTEDWPDILCAHCREHVVAAVRAEEFARRAEAAARTCDADLAALVRHHDEIVGTARAKVQSAMHIETLAHQEIERTTRNPRPVVGYLACGLVAWFLLAAAGMNLVWAMILILVVVVIIDGFREAMTSGAHHQQLEALQRRAAAADAEVGRLTAQVQQVVVQQDIALQSDSESVRRNVADLQTEAVEAAYRAHAARCPECASSHRAVRLRDSYRSEHTWEFDNPAYARAFAEVNAEKVSHS